MEHKQGEYLVRFDWALKRLLRNKANYAVLEGFLSVLLKEDVHILNITDSEGNQENNAAKFNRVDILVENTERELFIIELQNNNQVDYFLRMLYGVSKAVTDHIKKRQRYVNIRKVYHINIVYFEFGQGKDYVYHGTAEFRGIHRNDLLQLTDKQKSLFGREDISRVYPEYYILRVEDFDGKAKDSLDEWIYFLKNNAIPEEFTAKGLAEAREALSYEQLSDEEKKRYDYDIEQELYERSIVEDSWDDGHDKGLEGGLKKGLDRGREEGRKAQQIKTIHKLHAAGWTPENIAGFVELTVKQVMEAISLKTDN